MHASTMDHGYLDSSEREAEEEKGKERGKNQKNQENALLTIAFCMYSLSDVRTMLYHSTL